MTLRASWQDLGDGAKLLLVASWVSEEIAALWFARLEAEIPWEQGHVSFFGRSVAEPRLTAWFGDREYTYSGRTVKPRPFPALVAEIERELATTIGESFNSVLLNLYRDGSDSMGFHADDERELGKNPTIASVSLGATRRFVLAPRKGPKLSTLSYELGSGSLLVMAGTLQHTFRHAVPKSKKVTGARINLTFRNVV